MGSDLAARFVRLEQALGLIRPGNRVYLGTGCAAPQACSRASSGCSPARRTSSWSAS